ncbi:hypothetical protein DI09_104p70 [Mitosporidium daphniae]|uniref:Uncharacterized protein n=1 Tax=Mitosporidium daphniae TaxID=1485682 RepID=A0A098VWA6_9MICR|nr:uncharacterized protein DI09_104p70 [Mitosporidium daphniae]KGG53200.1 hypothetical protein DI09_104p70 [Mitosporidium daphniae]|eukprot:XP_013239638.1 uncharacterized protein DI09_104p70 [Mitosporidium daphniae]
MYNKGFVTSSSLIALGSMPIMAMSSICPEIATGIGPPTESEDVPFPSQKKSALRPQAGKIAAMGVIS